ncbi:MAG: redoxin domain-containing protein [Acidobacteria bacterium]|nr:redoxin domain-containing protein [Acidobacteriota bacterium]MBI3425353.1 redoxin domain-containing protein [Acidobacteriota bacterium]
MTTRAADPGKQTVIYDEVATAVATPPAAMNASGDLWVTLADLTRATRFALKPQGVCRDELCFPLPKNRKTAFLRPQGKTNWFNLSEFARLLHQPVAREAETWYFGERPEVQNAFVGSLTAPDFTLPDVNGKPHALHDLRGKKVLLITWASW